MRAAPPDLESLSAQEVLTRVFDGFHPRLYVACSFHATTRSAARSCTVAGRARDGRWAGTDKIECGLHPTP